MFIYFGRLHRARVIDFGSGAKVHPYGEGANSRFGCMHSLDWGSNYILVSEPGFFGVGHNIDNFLIRDGRFWDNGT